MKNPYIPFASRILKVNKLTAREYTFRMAYDGPVKPGQFFEVSIPEFGEAPISVCGIGEGYIELTIRRVGRVTNEVFEYYEGETLFLRGPYGNGFDLDTFRDRDLIVVAGGTGAAPVRALIDYFACNPGECASLTVLASFKNRDEILFADDFRRWKENARVLVSVTRDPDDVQHLHGRVTAHIPNLELSHPANTTVIVVGPHGLMHACAEMFVERGLKEEQIWISEERRMCCGIGKCGHCRINEKYICLDGPVFNYTEGKKLLD